MRFSYTNQGIYNQDVETTVTLCCDTPSRDDLTECWCIHCSVTSIRERPLDSQGGAWFFFEKKILALVLAKKKNSGLDHVWKKYLGSIHWKKNVCPLSMKIKCLPYIHEKKMSALYIHENKMLALYKWYYHGSRKNVIFVSLSWSWWRNVGS